MFDKLESLIDRLLRKYNMNDCWKSKSEDEIKIYFSEDKKSNRRFLFRAKLEVTGKISYEFSLDELGDVDVSKLEYYPGGYSGFYSSDSDPTIIEQSLLECLNDLDIDKLEEVIEYRNYIYDNLDGWMFDVFTEII